MVLANWVKSIIILGISDKKHKDNCRLDLYVSTVRSYLSTIPTYNFPFNSQKGGFFFPASGVISQALRNG